jgi:anti-sigma regulatory factor (Ser/Thr protein kinase)
MSECPPPRRQDQLTLAALLTAVRCGRLFVRYDLREWGIPRDDIETAEQLVAELVTGAVRATGITSPQPTFSEVRSGLKPIRVRLLLFDESVVVQVWDSSPEPPTPAVQGPDANGGSSTLESVGTQLGYYHPLSGGKVVWCQLSLVGPSTDDVAD